MNNLEKMQRQENIKIKLSLMMYSINDSALQSLLRYIVFTLCGDVLDWEKVYKKMKELMPEVVL